MRIRCVPFAAAVLVAAAGSAFAAQRSTVTEAIDEHTHIDICTPTKRITVTGLIGQPTTFTFPDWAHVYRLMQARELLPDGKLGNAPWQGIVDENALKTTPILNVLPLWPVVAGESIMTITLRNKEGTLANCSFKLVALPDPTGKPDEPGTVFNEIVKVADPGGGPEPTTAQKEAKVAVARKRQDTADLEVAKERLKTDSFNRSDGCHYHAAGDPKNRAIEPLCPMDNGIWTLMRFPGLSQKPTVYIGDVCDGTPQHERLPEQHGEGDLIVVHEIAAHFCLRLAPYVLGIVNEAYNPAGQPTGTGTISPGVVRQVLREKTAP